MKKETIVVAVVFFVLGFLTGYVYDAQQNWKTQQRAASGTRMGEPIHSGAGVVDSPAEWGLRNCRKAIRPSMRPRSSRRSRSRPPRTQRPGTRVKLANYFYDQHQYPQAAEWYQKALELDPKNANAHTDLGTTYFYLGRAQDALREYRKTLQIDPKHEPTMFNLIVVYLEGIHDVAAAQQAWDRLHNQNPNYPGLERLKQSLDAARASARP